jgi:hypothetical protein
LARAIWFVVSFPIRALSWFTWQCARAGYSVAAGLMRRIGQRNSVLLFSAVVGLTGTLTVAGIVQRGPLVGFFLIVVALGLAFGAWLRGSNDRVAPPMSGFIANLRYDPAEWRLSWYSVLLVGSVIAVLGLALGFLALNSN